MYEIIIVGAGPIGMNAAIELAKRNVKVAIFDIGDDLGGQLTVLYPDKEIVDLPGIATIKAKDYIAFLRLQIEQYPQIDVHLKRKVQSFDNIPNGVRIHCGNESYEARKILITTGLGAFIPRKMNIVGEDECTNILYSLDNLKCLEKKRVLVLGGGDSALDWTKEISQISDSVTIIHRRKEFRGNFATISQLQNVIVKTPYVPLTINLNEHRLISLTIKNMENENIEHLNADFVFVNYGFISANEFFGLANNNGGILVNNKMQTSQENIYAIGDIARYDNKIRRIAPGLEELAIFLQSIKEND